MDNTLKSLYTKHNAKTYNELLELFESNYCKILKFIPRLRKITHNSVIRHHDKQDLYLFVKVKTPYTATFILTHKFDTLNRPDIQFKVYFDAKLLEVLSARPYLAQCRDINTLWDTNIFMQKWLEYCLKEYQGLTWQTQ